MGNNASAMIRRSRSKIFREQGDSPETTISDAAPSPPQLRPSTISPFRFGSPKSSTANVRKEEEAATLIGDSSPTRRSKARKVPQLGQGPPLALKQLEKPSLTFPVLSITVPTSNITTVAQDKTSITTNFRNFPGYLGYTKPFFAAPDTNTDASSSFEYNAFGMLSRPSKINQAFQ
ncbi:MAG: hypothetical protein Q9195_004444 [Heterodermia aff. obscurata]